MRLCSTDKVVLQWAPAHCGLPGDEKVDELATLGAKGRQQDNSVTFQEKKILISETLGQCTERDDSTSSTSHSRLLDYTWATNDSTPTCTCRKMKFGTITNLQRWS